MPQYLYTNGEVTIEVVQTMSEPHVFEKDGIKYDRVFTPIKASIDTKIDPYSSQDFTEKTGKKKGSLNDLFQVSAELSEKRAQKDGVDNVKEQYYENYSEKRGGKRHPDLVKSEAIKSLDKMGVSVE